MKIDSLKQRVMKACLCAMVLMGACSVGNAQAALDIDTVDQHMMESLTSLTNRGAGNHYGHILHNYTTQRDQIKRFLRNFLNRGLDGSPVRFLDYLKTRLAKFHATVIKPMEGDANIAQIHKEMNTLYKEFVQFKDVLEKNKNTKSAYILAPQFLKYRHLVFGDIKAEYGVQNVLDGLGHRLVCTGGNIGMETDMPYFDFQMQSMVAA